MVNIKYYPYLDNTKVLLNHKEKTMEKRLRLGMLVMTLALGMMVTGCDNGSGAGSGSVDPALLVGTWVDHVYEEGLRLDNGSFYLYDDFFSVLYARGSYTANTGQITMTLSEIRADFSGFAPAPGLPIFGSRDEIRPVMIAAGMNTAEVDKYIDGMFTPLIGTYIVHGNTLTFNLSGTFVEVECGGLGIQELTVTTEPRAFQAIFTRQP